MLAYKILEKIAEEQGWKYFSVVEDSFIFDDGLTLIGYPDEAAKAGYEDGELGSYCLDVSSIRNNKVFIEEEGEAYDLPEYLAEHNIGFTSRKGTFQWRPYLTA